MSRRSFLKAAAASAALVMMPGAAGAGDLREIRLDRATYNPLRLALKEHGLVEKAFASDGIVVRWVQSRGSNKALEYSNAGSIDLGSTAGAATLDARTNGNPIKAIYV